MDATLLGRAGPGLLHQVLKLYSMMSVVRFGVSDYYGGLHNYQYYFGGSLS